MIKNIFSTFKDKPTKLNLKFIILSLLFLTSVPTVVLAGANILVTPTRIVFEERSRAAQVTLMNNGTETGDFRISFINQNMNEHGQFEAVKKGQDGAYANSMVRYSPRQITLPPGQSQVIRLMLRKPRDLDNGEYRSHMLFQSMPKASNSSVKLKNEASSKGITVEIIPIIGISIPVIIRHGKLESKLSLSDAHIIPSSKKNPVSKISVSMHRRGNQSIYGDFRAIFKSNNIGTETVIALANGVAVYTPNTQRQFLFPINTPSGMNLSGGKIRIIFLESGKNEDTGLIAETSLAL